jgi:hypothetical protein
MMKSYRKVLKVLFSTFLEVFSKKKAPQTLVLSRVSERFDSVTRPPLKGGMTRRINQ